MPRFTRTALVSAVTLSVTATVASAQENTPLNTPPLGMSSL